MPTFDFLCPACHAKFEGVIAFGSTTYPACPSCTYAEVEKLLSPPLGIHFRGSGFYKTDSQSAASTQKQAKEPKTAPKAPSTPKTQE